MTITRRNSILYTVAMLAMPAMAQEQRSMQLTFVVPFPPGGSTDQMSRMIAERMSRSLGQAIVIDNKAGAVGLIGTEFIARAAPDGLILGAVGGSTGVLAHLMGPVPRYKFDDLTYVGQLGYVEFVLVARKNLAANNVKELIDLAKASPGKLSYGYSGTAGQLGMELFKNMTRTDIVQVPYKGDAPALVDLVGGHVDLGMVTVAGSIGQIKAGTVKVIGVASKIRSRAIPDAPTIAESGLNGYEAGVPTMLAMPKATPRPIVDRMNVALTEALSDSVLVERFASMGLGVNRYTPAEADGVMKAEYNKSARLLKEANIPTER